MSTQWKSVADYIAHRSNICKVLMCKYGISSYTARRAMFFKETMEEIEEGIEFYLINRGEE